MSFIASIIFYFMSMHQALANPLNLNLDEHLMILDVAENEWREANYVRVDKMESGPEGQFIDFPYVEYSNGDRSVFVADSETARGLCLYFNSVSVAAMDTSFSGDDKSFFQRGLFFKKLYAVQVQEGRLIETVVEDSTPLIKQLHCK